MAQPCFCTAPLTLTASYCNETPARGRRQTTGFFPRQRPRPLVFPGSAFRGFGAPGEGTKRITVSGNVANPGVYFVPADTTLYGLLMRLGECSGLSDLSLPPRDVLIKWIEGDNSPKNRRQPLYRTIPIEGSHLVDHVPLTEQTLDAIALPPESVLYFPELII